MPPGRRIQEQQNGGESETMADPWGGEHLAEEMLWERHQDRSYEEVAELVYPGEQVDTAVASSEEGAARPGAGAAPHTADTAVEAA